MFVPGAKLGIISSEHMYARATAEARQQRQKTEGGGVLSLVRFENFARPRVAL